MMINLGVHGVQHTISTSMQDRAKGTGKGGKKSHV